MIDPEFHKFLLDNGHALVREISGDRWAALTQFAFTYAIVSGKVGDRTGYDDRWCYRDINDAARALLAWDGTGEPTGWHRHPATGRRRPAGKVEEEYINP